MEEGRSQPPHIALLSGPGTGQLIPLAALAKHLLHRHNFSITLITQPTVLSSQAQKSILNTLPKKINIISLPQVPTESIPNGTKPHARILLTIAHNLPYLRDVLKSIASTTPLVALVVDILGACAFNIAREVGASPYLFFTTNSLTLSLGFYLPTLDATTEGEYRDLTEPVQAPGCMPVHGRDLPDSFEDRGSETYKEFLHFLKLYQEPKGILVNSFEELEPEAFKALKAKKTIPPIYPVGPLVWSGPTGGTDVSDCLKWLDEQPRGSVMYVSFGSGGALTCEQMKELAWGLEMSGQRFLWVVKSPHDSDASASYFGVRNGKDPLEFLHEDGFIERIKGLGLIVPLWAPQIEVLSHGSTGGFLTHCGWNSALESIVKGVPLIAWPLYAEQKTNAALLVEDLKVALRARPRKSGVVEREEIARLVRCVMEGEEGKRLRSRMQELRDAAALALEDGGSSFRSFSEVAREWNNLKDLFVNGIRSGMQAE